MADRRIVGQGRLESVWPIHGSVLVLDDVLSELDPTRCSALLRNLPPGQVVLTTAGVLPDAAHPDAKEELIAAASELKLLN